MPRPILRTPQQQTQTNSLLSTAPQQRQQMKQAQQLDKMKMDRLLRKPRSKAYMSTIRIRSTGLSMRFGRNFPKWSWPELCWELFPSAIWVSPMKYIL